MRLLLATCLLTIALAGTAQAAPTWLDPVDVGSQGPTACQVDIGLFLCDSEVDMAPDGTAYLGAVVADGSLRRAGVAVRRPGGQFGDVQFLSPAGKAVQGFGIPQVVDRQFDMAVDRDGGVTAAWSVRDSNAPERNLVQAAYRPPGATSFRAPQTLSDPSESAEKPSVGVSDGGGAVIVWRNRAGTVLSVKATFRARGSLTFGPAATISDASALGPDVPDVDMNARGDAVAVWVQNRVVEGVVRPAGQPFQSIRTPLSNNRATVPTINASDFSIAIPDVAIAPGGQITAVWQHDPLNTVSKLDDTIQAAERSVSPSFADAAWGPAATITLPGENGVNPTVGLDAENTATAVWFGRIGGVGQVRSAARASGGGFTGHQPVSGPDTATFAPTPQVEVSPQGDATAIWARHSNPAHVVEAAVKPKGRPFGAVEILEQGSGTGADRRGVALRPPPSVSFDNQGNGIATWMATTGLDEFGDVKSASFDAAAPAITGVVVPTVATTGAAVAMSAAATDRLSGASLSWSFGDGSSATGSPVSHAYAAPGVFTVRITARDAVGNASSTTRTIQVTAPPPPGVVDGDGDGFGAPQDCDDGDARRFPGASDVPGDGIDQSCDGADALVPDITSPVSTSWSVDGRRVTLVRMRVRSLPAGARVTLRCKGARCRFRSVRAPRARRGATNVLAALRGRRTFRAGQTLEVRITARGFDGKVVRFRLVRRKVPTGRTLCLPEGARRVQRSC